MDSVTLEQVIRRYISLPSMPSGGGWYPILCKVCNDHGRKGPRGGFKFDGDTVAYHCFNCGHSTVYDPETHRSMPQKMQQVLRDFGVPDEEWQQVLFASLANKDAGLAAEAKKKIIAMEPEELEMPDTFYLLKDAPEDDKWAQIARYYLEEDRGIDPDSYPFMLASKSEDPRMNKWLGRVIIPIYKQEKLIFYQGRDLTDSKLKKYESPATSRDKVLYGFDKLFENSELPLYIVEGWFDAFMIDGVALLGNEISKPQIEWLNRSRRKKVYIPDRFGDGKRGANVALANGWHISTPEIGSCKDMSDAVLKYGKLYVMKSIVDNTAIGFDAETKLGVYCKWETRQQKKK